MREIIPRTISAGVEEPPVENKKSSNVILITGIVAAAAMIYVIRSDVSSQKEWTDRYGR
jgi:hypothetical protein